MGYIQEQAELLPTLPKTRPIYVINLMIRDRDNIHKEPVEGKNCSFTVNFDNSSQSMYFLCLSVQIT